MAGRELGQSGGWGRTRGMSVGSQKALSSRKPRPALWRPGVVFVPLPSSAGGALGISGLVSRVTSGALRGSLPFLGFFAAIIGLHSPKMAHRRGLVNPCDACCRTSMLPPEKRTPPLGLRGGSDRCVRVRGRSLTGAYREARKLPLVKTTDLRPSQPPWARCEFADPLHVGWIRATQHTSACREAPHLVSTPRSRVASSLQPTPWPHLPSY